MLTAARATLAIPRPPRGTRRRLRLSIADDGALVAETTPAPDRIIFDAHGSENLPGVRVRVEDEPPTGDASADEAYDGLGATFDFFWDAFARNGIDGHGGSLLATVHFGDRYDNAFWNGERMVFGDGDGEVFTGFTRSLSVIAHELAHGVTEFSGGLDYENQSGALNESLSDVFGALADQHASGQRAGDASWLIGAGIFTDAVQGTALRSMQAPGTAYDDDVLGKDPQPGHMRDYVDTRDDNGGVHINSGIPNRAFTLVAKRLGGNAWEDAGRIWYASLGHERLLPTATFRQFARITRYVALTLFGNDSRQVSAVEEAWSGVGVGL